MIFRGSNDAEFMGQVRRDPARFQRETLLGGTDGTPAEILLTFDQVSSVRRYINHEQGKSESL